MASEAKINSRPQGNVITAPEDGRPVLKQTQPKILPKSPKISSPQKQKAIAKKSLEVFVLSEKIESVRIEAFNPADDASIKSSVQVIDNQIDEKEFCAVTTIGKVKKISMQGLEVSSPLIRSPKGPQTPKVELSLGSTRSKSAIDSPLGPLGSPATPYGPAKFSADSSFSPKVLKKRCRWITSQSDPAYV